MPRRLAFLLDVDEVLADFQTAALGAVGEVTGKHLTPADFTTWDILGQLPGPVQDAARERISAPGFCASLAPVAGAVAAVKQLRQLVDIHVATKPWPSPTWMTERLAWLSRWFGIEAEAVTFTHRKSLIRADLMLDDNPYYVSSWMARNPCGVAMLWDIPNTRVIRSAALRVGTWGQVLAEVAVRVSAHETA